MEMKVKVKVPKPTEYEEKELEVKEIEKRIPVWVNPCCKCAICGKSFDDYPDVDYVSAVLLEDGRVIWVHEHCLCYY